mmetsp:Transcript_1157/g.2413  ORF Transcript_1157/g.2413 Transcript_1157/m.2413 type:complete len:220 (-) Transcript_1157:80-739(-)
MVMCSSSTLPGGGERQALYQFCAEGYLEHPAPRPGCWRRVAVPTPPTPTSSGVRKRAASWSRPEATPALRSRSRRSAAAQWEVFPSWVGSPATERTGPPPSCPRSYGSSPSVSAGGWWTWTATASTRAPRPRRPAAAARGLSTHHPASRGSGSGTQQRCCARWPWTRSPPPPSSCGSAPTPSACAAPLRARSRNNVRGRPRTPAVQMGAAESSQERGSA